MECWYGVGICCGGYQYLGVTTAAAYARKRFAFALRLGLVLSLSGAAVVVTRLRSGFVTYDQLILTLALIFVALTMVGVSLMGRSEVRPVGRPLDGWRDSGLLIVFLVFIGQTGFLVFVVQTAGSRLPLGEVIWAFAAVKVAAGLVLLGQLRLTQEATSPRFLELGIALAIAIVAVGVAPTVITFFLTLWGFEIAFNLLSARLQASVRSASWLNAAVLLGAAIGPALNGIMIDFGFGTIFIVAAVASALLPAAAYGDKVRRS